jgi:predicted amidohydrolase YtcJ
MAVGWAQSPQNLPSEVIAYADLVFYNGKILTADEEFTIVEAVAIRDGKFLARGDNDRILAMAGPRTRRVDLEGRSLVPGFIDTHQHSSFVTSPPSGRGGPEINFDTVESALEGILARVRQAQPGEFIALGSTSNKVVTEELNVALLDQVSPNNPLYIRGLNNQVVANSLVLKEVPPDTPGILRDEQGRPTGQLRGGAGGVVVYEIRPWPEMESLLEPQKTRFRRHNGQGLTTIIGRANGLSISVFRELMKRDELTLRVRVAHEFLRQNSQPEAYLKRLGNLTDFGNNMFRIIGATVQVVDGASLTGSARTSKAKLNPPQGDPYGPFGQNKWEETGDVATSDRRNIILGNRYGWTISGLHSSGDMSNTILLGVFEEAHRERSLVGRHFGIDHGLMWKPEHFEKIKEMDVVPSLFAKGMYENDDLVSIYGMDEVYKMQPVKSLIEAGIRPAAEADAFNVRTQAALFNMQKWITRLDDKGRLINPEEKINRSEALYMYTLWAARYSGEQETLGSIEPGKLADLVVLGGDFMTFPENDLDKLRILMTVVGGRIVHETAGAF